MSLRAKLAIVLASLAAMAALSVGWLSYDATSDRMLSEIDNTLRSANDARGNRLPGEGFPGVIAGAGGVGGIGGIGGGCAVGSGHPDLHGDVHHPR